MLVNHVETKNKRGYYGKPRYCKTCKAYKVTILIIFYLNFYKNLQPDRCHHCSVCNKCVLKMDHHVFYYVKVSFYQQLYWILQL